MSRYFDIQIEIIFPQYIILRIPNYKPIHKITLILNNLADGNNFA